MTRISTIQKRILTSLTSISIGMLIVGCGTQKLQTERLISETDINSLISQAQELENLGSLNRALISWNTALTLAFEQDNRSPAIKIAGKIEGLLTINSDTRIEPSTRVQAAIVLARLSFKFGEPATALEPVSYTHLTLPTNREV